MKNGISALYAQHHIYLVFWFSGFLVFSDIVYKNIRWVIGPMNLNEYKNQLYFGWLIDIVINIF